MDMMNIAVCGLIVIGGAAVMLKRKTTNGEKIDQDQLKAYEQTSKGITPVMRTRIIAALHRLELIDETDKMCLEKGMTPSQEGQAAFVAACQDIEIMNSSTAMGIPNTPFAAYWATIMMESKEPVEKEEDRPLSYDDCLSDNSVINA